MSLPDLDQDRLDQSIQACFDNITKIIGSLPVDVEYERRSDTLLIALSETDLFIHPLNDQYALKIELNDYSDPIDLSILMTSMKYVRRLNRKIGKLQDELHQEND